MCTIFVHGDETGGLATEVARGLVSKENQTLREIAVAKCSGGKDVIARLQNSANLGIISGDDAPVLVDLLWRASPGKLPLTIIGMRICGTGKEERRCLMLVSGSLADQVSKSGDQHGFGEGKIFSPRSEGEGCLSLQEIARRLHDAGIEFGPLIKLCSGDETAYFGSFRGDNLVAQLEGVAKKGSVRSLSGLKGMFPFEV